MTDAPPSLRLPAPVAWVLALGSLALAAHGFTTGRQLAPASLGYPGVAATFLFLLLARLRRLTPAEVARLGTWLLYGGGAAVAVGLGGGVWGLARGTFQVPALVLTVLGCPLLAVASLRLSTAKEGGRGFQGAAVAFLLVAGGGTLELVKQWSSLGLPG